MRRQVIVGCYTPGDYEREANERLIPSVHALGLAMDVRVIPSRGSWVKNNSACQLFLQRILPQYDDTDLLYIDVDGMVRSDPWPLLSTLSCDIGCHFLDGEELLSGTLYLPAGPNRKRLIDAWVLRNEQAPDVWDQKNLQALLAADSTFRVATLPPEYCCIFDIHRKRFPKIVPVVEHFQASRRFKKRVQPI